MIKNVVLFVVVFLPFILMAQQQPNVGINVGNKAPEIALPTSKGDTVKLSSLRGKLVLIDFWASWCNPCRKENPVVVAAYNKYKDTEFINGKGFTVYGVSLDKDKESWLNAIEKDNLTWTNVSDLQFWNCVAAKEYSVMGIPSNFLIDENGVIIAKSLRGNALDEFLEKLVKPDPVETILQYVEKTNKLIAEMKNSDTYTKYKKNINKIEKLILDLEKEVNVIKSEK